MTKEISEKQKAARLHNACIGQAAMAEANINTLIKSPTLTADAKIAAHDVLVAIITLKYKLRVRKDP